MKDIKNFKKIHYYSGDKELTNEEAHAIGVCVDPINGDYWTSEERAYQAAYDISNDWAKETPDWDDVQEGFRKGIKEGIDFIINIIEDKIDSYADDPGGSDAIAQRKYALEIILDKINKEIE